jgi:hypothetical protein
MGLTRPIEHAGHRTILFGLTGLSTPIQWNAAVAADRSFFRALPSDGSALTLTDVSSTRYNRETVDVFESRDRAMDGLVRQ